MATTDQARIEFDPAMMASLLRALKGYQQDWATATRRELRRSGDDTIRHMRARVASGPGRRDVGVRTGIQAGMKTAVATGKRRQGVRIVASGARIPDAHKAMLRLYNKRSFRHPVFGSDTYVIQRGHPYFGRTIALDEDDMIDAIERALAEAIRKMAATR